MSGEHSLRVFRVASHAVTAPSATGNSLAFNQAVYISELEREVTELTYELEDTTEGTTTITNCLKQDLIIAFPALRTYQLRNRILQVAMRAVMRYCQRNRNGRWRIQRDDPVARLMDTMAWMLRLAMRESEEMSPEY
jgi:hypothetical protein